MKESIEYNLAFIDGQNLHLPNKKFASSLYKKLGSEFYDYIENIKSYVNFNRNEKGS